MWATLDQIPARTAQPIVDQSSRSAEPRWRRPTLGFLAAAAAVALLVAYGAHSGWIFSEPKASAAIAQTSTQAEPQTKVLADGTRVRLNTDTAIVEEFSPRERRVRLTHGEAYFIVTKDPARPFVVHAGAITVRAVGTAFNVRWETRAVDVLVTEGKVQVNPSSSPAETVSPPGAPLVNAGERARVEVTSARPRVVVSQVSQAAIAQTLAWHIPLRRLGATLVDLAHDFERQTGRRLVVADPELRELQVGGRFRGDDLAGLLRLLEENYGIAVEDAADGSVVLRKVK